MHIRTSFRSDDLSKQTIYIKGIDMRKTKSENTGSQDVRQLTFDDILGTGPLTKTNKKTESDKPAETPKTRKKRTKTVTASATRTGRKNKATDEKPTEAVPGFMNPPEPGGAADTDNATPAPEKKNTPRKSVLKSKSKPAADSEKDTPKAENSTEPVTYKNISPCPFSVGECVEARDYKRFFTVLNCNKNIVRVIDNDNGSDYTICCADLQHSDKKARTIEEE